ncbi:YckD family protein [Bacillus sp. Marseille-P3661]|uniref:YckD family protein n=1 Tax=Bacillus sp. Marseille-P3661 TaxID=1936234 RepID=UPI000C83CEE5|nr:YckD family protein [Bacillus sp. Marseille-P3661]
MKKLTILLSALIFSMALALPVFANHHDNDGATQQPAVELTDKQKKELEKLHSELLQKKSEMIDKHVEFGIITKEKGEKIKVKLAKRFEKMKENGFIPMHHGHKHCDGKDKDGENKNQEDNE